jgi:hypothetical protein
MRGVRRAICVVLVLLGIAYGGAQFSVSSVTSVMAGSGAHKEAAQQPYKGACDDDEQIVHPVISQSQLGRIAIRDRTDTPEFYDTTSDEKFIPRGYNYIRLAKLDDPWGGYNFGHSLFHPDLYDRQCVRRSLERMAADGNNVVRVFVSEISVGNARGGGVDKAYAKNVANFVAIARDNGIRVLIVFWSLPRLGGYQLDAPAPAEFEGVNGGYLYRPAIDKKKQFVRDFISVLKGEGAPLEAVFAWELENEAHYIETQKPLSLRRGLVRTANGRSYDMSLPSDRQEMMDEGMVFWADQVTSAVREVDPEGLVTISTFSPLVVEGNDVRITRTKPLVQDPEHGGASIDFVSIHAYPGSVPVDDELAAFEISPSRKPVVLSEMGISYPRVFPQFGGATKAASTLRHLQVLSCTASYRVTGWILYTWDTFETANGARDLYTAVDEGGVIRDVMSPARRPDPCAERTAQLEPK